MKQLSRFQSILFLVGGALMVIGVGCFVFMLVPEVTSWVFLAGCILFATMQLMQSYEGQDITLRRLKKIQNLTDILFILAGIDMVDTAFKFFLPLFSNYESYITILYNKWPVLLLIAAVLEVYTTHRIDHELSKKTLKE